MPPIKLQVVIAIPGKDPREFEYELDVDRISVGRDQSNEIQVPLSTVSRTHCTLTHDGREWYLEDLRSTHGTKHNGKPLSAGAKKLMRDGDVIDLVHCKLSFFAEKQRSEDYSAEKTEALARKMVEEVLAQIGNDAQGMPYLRVMNGPDEGKKLNIGPDVSEATIGRGADCEFQINDANVSRRHAVIRRDWNEITIEDAGSKNGVVVNERRITKPTPLRDADEIMLGAMKLTFIDPTAKFLGKLDDIPAFQEQHEEEPEPQDEPQDHDEPMDAMPEARDFPREPLAPMPGGTKAKGVPAFDAFGDDDIGPELGAFDDELDTGKGLGAAELVLIVLAVLAVIGLAAGVALLFFNT